MQIESFTPASHLKKRASRAKTTCAKFHSVQAQRQTGMQHNKSSRNCTRRIINILSSTCECEVPRAKQNPNSSEHDDPPRGRRQDVSEHANSSRREEEFQRQTRPLTPSIHHIFRSCYNDRMHLHVSGVVMEYSVMTKRVVIQYFGCNRQTFRDC